MHNLRPTTTPGTLTGIPAPRAQRLDATPVIIPASFHTAPDGRPAILVHHDGWICRQATRSYTPMPLYPVDDIPTAILPLPDGDHLHFYAPPATPRRYTYTGTGWTYSTPFAAAPPVMLTRLDGPPLTLQTAPLPLHGNYDERHRTLLPADLAAITRLTRQTYITLHDLARTDSNYIQPVIARYRIIAPDSTILYTSAPVLITPRDTLPLNHIPFTLQTTPDTTLLAADISVTPYTIVPRILPGADDILQNATIEIQTTPQLHRLSLTAPSHIRITPRSGSTTTLLATATTPGHPADSAAPAAVGTPLHTLVQTLLDNLDTVMSAHGTHRFATTTDEITRLRRLVATPVHPVDYPQLLPPHTFVPTATCISADTAAHAGLTPIPFPGHGLPELTAATIETPGTILAATTIQFADLTNLTRTITLRDHTPTHITPLIAYPHPDARRIIIRTAATGATYPLTPTPGARYAFHLDPNLQPLPTTGNPQAVTPVSNPPLPATLPAVAIAPSSDPLALTAVTPCGTAPLLAIHPAQNSTTPIDSSTLQLYALGPGGTHLLTASSTRRQLRPRHIDPRPILRPTAVCPTPQGPVAIAGTDLLLLRGRSPVTIAHLTSPALHILYASPTDELTLFPADTSKAPRIINLTTRRTYTRTLPVPLTLISPPSGHPWLTAADNTLIDLTDETSTSPVTIRHTHRFSATRTHTISLHASDINAAITLRGDLGNPLDTFPLDAYTVTGSPRLPLTLPIDPGPATHITRTLTLTTTKPLEIQLNEP